MLDLIYSNTTVKVIQAGILDSWGQTTAGTAVTAQCSMRELTLLEQDSLVKGNKELKLEAVLRFNSSVDIRVNDKVLLNDTAYTVIKIKRIRDLAGETMAILAYV